MPSFSTGIPRPSPRSAGTISAITKITNFGVFVGLEDGLEGLLHISKVDKDIEQAGLTPGDIVEVKDGYGRNFLMPRGFAIAWTRGGEKTIESIKKARSARAVRDAMAPHLADGWVVSAVDRHARTYTLSR